MLIGGYYSLDAIFSLCNGVFTGQTFMENFMLNAPHVGITVLVAFALYNSVRKENNSGNKTTSNILRK